MAKREIRKLAVLDLETDPFSFGRIPKPFLCGFYDGTEYATIWDEHDCIDKAVAYLERKKQPYIIYAHNGGKFDWFYFLKYLTNRSFMRIINSRIVQAYLGLHEIRDSFAIMPFPLAKYNKKEIEIDKLRAERRNAHRDEIIEYLRVDCVSLYELVTAFWSEFGDALTVGSAGLRELKKFHSFSCGGPEHDKRFREPYYYGGRVEVFQPGIVKGPIHVLDVNSMYPYVMKAFRHPIGVNVEVSKRIHKNTAFVTAEGFSRGAFAVRTKDGISFPHQQGIFHTTIHEWRAAYETDTFTCDRIIETYGFDESTRFDKFVTHFYDSKVAAKVRGDKIREIFYKYVLNSTYGKFAQNPENFSEYCVTTIGEIPPDTCDCDYCHKDNDSSECKCGGWHTAALANEYHIWKKPIAHMSYYNIATAASVTGAARAMLIRGMCAAEGVIYCDTDSVFARSPGTLSLSDTELGGWKVEATAASAALCGKKLYALFDENGTCIKKAHKGIPGSRPGLQGITGDEIRKLATGELEYVKIAIDVPHFKMSGAHGFVSRKVRLTV